MREPRGHCTCPAHQDALVHVAVVHIKAEKVATGVVEAEDNEKLLGVDLSLDDLGITGMLAPRAVRTARATDARLFDEC